MITEIWVERAFRNDLAVRKRFRLSSFFFLRKSDSYELYKKKITFFEYSISRYFRHHKDNGIFRSTLFLQLFYRKKKLNKFDIDMLGRKMQG